MKHAVNDHTSGSVQAKLYSHLNYLTKSERKVAEFILREYDQVMYLSITDLAEQAGVGETTVLRFCRKLGYKGYQEFKLALAKDTGSPAVNLQRDLEDSDEMQVLMEKITRINMQALEETLGLLDSKELEKAVGCLIEASRILFIGVGSSGITALDAKAKFLRIGLPADALPDSHLQAMAAATLKEGDAAVGLSVSGSTRDTVDALRLAGKNGARVIAVTHFARSPVTKSADAILLTGGRETPLQGGSLAAKLAQLHVIDLLFTGAAMRMKEQAFANQEKTAKAVVHKIY